MRKQRVNPIKRPLNIPRFKALLRAVICGWRVRHAVRSEEVRAMAKKVRETAHLMYDLKRDKSLSSRMFLRNVKRQHTPHVKALIEAIHRSVKTRAWLPHKSLRQPQKKQTYSKHQKSMAATPHQRELSKYGLRDRSAVLTQKQSKATYFKAAAVTARPKKPAKQLQQLSLGHNLNELSGTMGALKSPKSPNASTGHKTTFKHTPITPTPSGRALLRNKTPK